MNKIHINNKMDSTTKLLNRFFVSVMVVVLIAFVAIFVIRLNDENEDMAPNIEAALDFVDMQRSLLNLQTSVSENYILLDSADFEDRERCKQELVLINSEIIETDNQMDTIINGLGNEKYHTYEQLYSEYIKLQKRMGDINKRVDQFNEKITSEINQLALEGDANKDTIYKLERVYSSLSNQNIQFENNISAGFEKAELHFTELESMYTKGFNDIENSLAKDTEALKLSMDENEEVILQAIDKSNNQSSESISENNIFISQLLDENTNSVKYQIDNFSSNYEHNFEKLKGKIEANDVVYRESLDAINDRLDQVFLYASEGKKGIAKALTGLGIETKENATFQTIEENIEELALLKYENGYEKGYTEGFAEAKEGINVTYYYHCHIDGGDVQEHIDNHGEQSDNENGCYNDMYEHYHSWDEGCYTYTEHVHNGECSPIYCSFYLLDWNSDGGDSYSVECGICHKKDVVNKNYLWSWRCYTVTGYSNCTGKLNSGMSIVCQKNEGKYYIPSCGYKDGELTKAVINF